MENYFSTYHLCRRILVFLFILAISIHGICQSRPAQVPENDPYYQMGYLDVTLFGADKSGIIISTQAIRNAITEAQKYQLACYFPSGTYLVDDTITGVMACVPSGTTCINDRRKPVYLVGAIHPRPVIKLTSNNPKFSNPAKPRPVIWFWAQPRDINTPASINPDDEQPDICFNMVIRNLIIDLGINPGAMAIRFAGAQGSAIEDVKIIATGAFAGISGTPGQAGGCYNIEVEGGRHAFYFHAINYGNGQYPTYVGITCRNQTEEVFKIMSLGFSMLVTGFYIEKQSGAIISGWAYRGGISFVDGIFNYTGTYGTLSAIPSVTNNLYMKNVYFKNCSKILSTDASSSLNSSIWTKVIDYKYTKSGNGANLIDGQQLSGISQLTVKLQDPPEPVEFFKKHTWDPLDFVTIEMRDDPDFVNVKDASKMTGPKGPALGNASNNDTEAIQWAIDHYKKVFIPKGVFMINKPLILRSQTQIFGSGKTFSVIRAMNSWNTGSVKTMIATDNDAQATTSISFLLLETNSSLKDLNKITWTAGKNSIIRDIMIGISDFASVKSEMDHQMLRFTGPTAGGRIYNYACENNSYRELTYHQNYRHILIENTSEPIKFYSCNVERVKSGVQFEIKNSSNIEIYFLKSEATTVNGTHSTPLLINNSEAINLFCLNGVFVMGANQALLEVNNSNNIIATHIVPIAGASNWYNASENFQGKQIGIASNSNLGVFSRNYNPSTSLLHFPENQVTIYPNPVQDVVFISSPDNNQLKGSVYNLEGIMLLSQQIQGNGAINVSRLPNGIYFVTLTGQTGKQTGYKLIKN